MRKKSKTGIYHVIMRGINRQNIFEDDEDYERFIETLRSYKAISEYEVYAYCLMGNHFHLLLKVGKENLELVIKRIAGSYVYWYNLKYRRSGHLFQDRYKSEAVEDDSYLLTVIRYIHQNPIKAGLCKCISDYEYSSYGDYVAGDSRLVDLGFALSIADKDSFIKFNNENKTDRCMDVSDDAGKINDADGAAIMQSISNCANSAEFQSLDTSRRDRYIRELRQKGLSIRQISRLTGVSFGIVRKQ
jgi:REP element-mobilizing transposase RayT